MRVNANRKDVNRFQLLEQRKRRVGVDGVVEADHRLQPFQIDGTITDILMYALVVNGCGRVPGPASVQGAGGTPSTGAASARLCRDSTAPSDRRPA